MIGVNTIIRPAGFASRCAAGLASPSRCSLAAQLVRVGVLRASLVGVLRASLVGVLQASSSPVRIVVLRRASLVGVLRTSQVRVGVLRASLVTRAVPVCCGLR